MAIRAPDGANKDQVLEVWGDQFVAGLLINDGQEFNFNERE